MGQDMMPMAVPARRDAHHNLDRYVGLSDHEIASELRRFVGTLLLRGRLETILARREIGGLLYAFARRHPRDRPLFESFALRTVGLKYDEARRHMQLWSSWPLCESTLHRLQDESRKRGLPFVVPGLRRLLALAGVVGRRTALALTTVTPPLPVRARLPSDAEALRAMVRRLLSEQRGLRARIVVLEGEAQYANERARYHRQEAVVLRRQIRHLPNLSDRKTR
jgi:hypothetical protein